MPINQYCEIKLNLIDIETDNHKHLENFEELINYDSHPDKDKAVAQSGAAKKNIMRKAIHMNRTLVVKDHLLKKPKKGKYNLCAVCNKKTPNPIYKCKTCGMSVHTNSVRGIANNCRGVTGSDAITLLKVERKSTDLRNIAAINIPHSFRSSKRKFVSCSHCGDSISSMIGASSHIVCTRN